MNRSSTSGSRVRGCNAPLLALIILCAVASTAQAGSPVSIRGDGASTLVAADFNNDGATDLAVANAKGGRIAVFLREPRGGFPKKPSRVLRGGTGETHIGAWVLGAGDVNADGKNDLILVDSLASSVSVFSGHGDGSFSAPTTLRTLALPSGVALGDFNGDRRVDLAVVSKGTSKVQIFLGNSEGQFNARGAFPVGSQPTSVVAEDFGSSSTEPKRDGKLDLAVTATGEREIVVLFGDGSGGFSPPSGFAAAGPTAIVAADFNHDGIDDLVTINPQDNVIGINFGIGFGTRGNFQGIALGPRLEGSVHPTGMAAADFDGDGKPDLAIAVEAMTPERSGVFVLLNRLSPGKGWVEFDPPKFCLTRGAPMAIAVGDFRGAGAATDLAVADKGTEGLSVFYGDGRGGLANCATPEHVGGSADDGQPVASRAVSTYSEVALAVDEGDKGQGSSR